MCLCPWLWPRTFLSLASRGSVLGKAVLGLEFFCVLGLEPSVLDSTSVNHTCTLKMYGAAPAIVIFYWNSKNCNKILFGKKTIPSIVESRIRAGLDQSISNR